MEKEILENMFSNDSSISFLKYSFCRELNEEIIKKNIQISKLQDLVTPKSSQITDWNNETMCKLHKKTTPQKCIAVSD